MSLLRMFFLVAWFSSAVAAQTSSQPENPAQNTAGPAQQTPAQQSSPPSEKELQKQEQSQRILGVVPQFGVTSRQNAAPLTTGQKFHLFVKSSFDPFQYVAAGFQAG